MSQATDVPAGSPRSVVAQRLREAGLPTDRFVKVEAGDKAAIEDFTDPANQYEPDAPELQAHVDQGGNVGVVCGRGLVVVDVDDREAAPDALEDLPGTLTVETPGGGTHHYLRAGWDDTRRFNWGEVRANGAYVVCPGGTHPNGGTYQVLVPASIETGAGETIETLVDTTEGGDDAEQRRDSVARVSEPGVADDAGNSNGRQGVSIGPDNEGAQTFATDTADPRKALDVENDVGLSLREIKRFSRKLNDCLMGLKRTDDPSPSETDFATVDLLHMYRFDRPAIERVLLSWRRVQDRHVVDDYIPRTLANADPLPAVPGPLLRTLVDQSDWTTNPDAGRDTIVAVTLAAEGLPEPFTTTEVVDTGLLDHGDATRDSVRCRALRTLKLLAPEYVRLGKSGGQYQCIRTDAFTDLAEYAHQVDNLPPTTAVISVRPSPAEDSKTAARRSDTAGGR